MTELEGAILGVIRLDPSCTAYRVRQVFLASRSDEWSGSAGAVYPAIDLTAGERERGTLEMLIAAPVPRLGLLLAKYAAVLTVALLTALVNLAAMTITVHSTGLAASLFGAGIPA